MLKDFADEAPRLFFHLLGIAPMGTEVEMRDLPRESAPAVVLPDYVAVLAIEAQDPFTFHVEFQLEYKKTMPETMARYGGSLAWQHHRPVVSILLLLDKHRAPEKIPDFGIYAIGKTTTRHPFKVVRAWEIAPAPILDAGDPRLFPWALLLHSTDKQVRRIAQELKRRGDEESIWRFLTLGSLRYDKTELEKMLGGGTRMGLVEAILEGSSLVREAKEKAVAQGHAKGLAKGIAKGLVKGLAEGRAKGLAEGREKGRAEGREKGREEGLAAGRAEEARRLLRACLKARFSGLDKLPEIESIRGVETVESLLPRVVKAETREEAKRLILAAVRGKK